MKLFGKICLIISIVLIGASALCLGVGVALGSSFKEVQTMADNGEFNIGNWTIGNGNFYFSTGNGNQIEHTYDFPVEEVEKFEMDITYGEIFFVDSDTEDITIHIDAPDRNSYFCELSGSTLSLEDKTRGYRGNLSGTDVSIEIAIPSGTVFDEVDIKTDAGALDATHDFEAKDVRINLGAGEFVAESMYAEDNLKVDVGAGNVEIYNFTTDELEIDCGVGNAELTGNIEKEAKADCGVGNITLVVFGDEKDYNYKIDCGVGEVNVNGSSYSSLSNKRHIDNGSDKDIYLDCGVGQIQMKTLKAGGV